ncbi:hypothetical protein BT63DRAFT_452264 [Microthyrium microscopicum]|uniref:Uncharacterized protein n=1 Tax=Microthyrium microscopicum TaxID=703497 RepID=A0A6A6UL17_9PEZI|nr:hypothetical protein BT63DRAFT_452264 [Microthyrium microscopicum]
MSGKTVRAAVPVRKATPYVHGVGPKSANPSGILHIAIEIPPVIPSIQTYLFRQAHMLSLPTNLELEWDESNDRIQTKHPSKIMATVAPGLTYRANKQQILPQWSVNDLAMRHVSGWLLDVFSVEEGTTDLPVLTFKVTNFTHLLSYHRTFIAMGQKGWASRIEPHMVQYMERAALMVDEMRELCWFVKFDHPLIQTFLEATALVLMDPSTPIPKVKGVRSSFRHERPALLMRLAEVEAKMSDKEAKERLDELRKLRQARGKQQASQGGKNEK